MNNCLTKLSDIISVLCLLFLLNSCDVYKSEICPAYVIRYVGVDSLTLRADQYVPENCIWLTGHVWPIRDYRLHSNGKDKEKYDQLCNKHNDVKYNTRRQFLNGTFDESSAPYSEYDFEEITVTSDMDFDDAHPAGSNLADIVRFMSKSPYKYIQSNYSSFYRYDESSLSEAFVDKMINVYCGSWKNDPQNPNYPIDKLVKDLTAEDLILLPYSFGMLHFEKAPDTVPEHTVTVSMKTDSGIEFTNSIKMTFSL